MYWIIGADDKEYGPVEAGQIRQWLREGRLNRMSRIKPENAPNWKVIGALPEFEDLFPPLPGGPPKPTGAPTNCGLATAALVCGALGLVTCVTAPVGLVLGLQAHSRIRQSNGQLTGSGLATAGIVLSLIAMLVGLLAVPAALLLPALAKAEAKAQSTHCQNNLRQLALAASMYSAANKGELPSASKWCDDLAPYVGSPKTFQCPAGDASQRGHYAFNAKLAKARVMEIATPAITVMFVETDQGWNASGGPEQILHSPRHGKVVVVGFADGHVEAVPRERLSKLNWNP